MGLLDELSDGADPGGTETLFPGDDAKLLEELAEKSKDRDPDSEEPTEIELPVDDGPKPDAEDEGDDEKPESEEKPEDEKPAEEPEKPEGDEPQAEVIDVDSIPLPSAEEQEKIAGEFKRELASVQGEVDAQFTSIAQRLVDREKTNKAAIEAIEAKTRDESEPNGERPLTFSETRELNRLLNEAESIRAEALKYANEYEQKLQERKLETFFRNQIKADPRLKPYETEFRKFWNSGFRPDKTDEMLAACKSLKRQQGAAPPKKLPTMAEVKAKVLEGEIANKKKGVINAGKGATASTKTEKADKYAGVPSHIRGALSGYDKEINKLSGAKR